MDSNQSLIFRAAQRGLYGKVFSFSQGSITDALFVFLDGNPEADSQAILETHFMARPWVCFTETWEKYIKSHFQNVQIFTRYMMKPRSTFSFLPLRPLPKEYQLELMDEAAFNQHPFGHGENYASYRRFIAEGAGAVVRKNGEIVASASSFLSMNGELELDVSTKEEHRGLGLATACVSKMLEQCMAKGFTVHWDAQNETSKHLAQKFGFELEAEYPVYSCRGFDTPTLCVETKGIKPECNSF